VLLDPRGVFVSLSHYCPTAADLLFSHVGPVEIVEGPPAIPQGNPEGLDARDVLPPVLVGAGVGHARRGQAGPGEEARVALLMDLDGYSAWEAHMVHALTTSSAPPEAVLPSLEADFGLLQQWRPGHRTLAAEVAALRDRDRAAADRAGLAPVSTDDRVLGRYLAARAFASWAAYQGGGVAAVLGELRRALALVRELSAELPLKEAIRQADWQLLHVDA
jgi:hypothetical protein